jgi:uncharacterized protein with GYD domain
MTRYLIEHIPVPQAAAAVIKNPEDRTEAIRTIFESVGGRLDHYYIAYGENTVYLLGEIPDEESLGAFMMSIWASGVSMSLKAKPIMTATEAVEVFKKAGTVGYRPPGG